MERSLAARIQRITGPLPGAKEARAYSILGLAAALIMCGFSLYYGLRGEPFMGRPMGYDFVQFYAAGQILNHGEPARIYDSEFLTKLEHQNLPGMAAGQTLLFGYAPYIAQLFRPFAMLSYRGAYCVWLAFSLALYGAGLMLLFHGALPGGQARMAYLLALSAPMYTLETWIGGQLSVVTFFAVALFVRCFERRRLLLAGLALGLASYKPSLIALPAAVMLLSASWRMLAGLCTSSAAAVLASIATAGVDGFGQWILRLQQYSSLATAGNAVFRRTKYMDLNSFFAVLLGENLVARTLAAAAICATFLLLAWTCWRARNQSHEVQRYLWAAAITWTLIINIYVAVYDTIILVPALALAAYSVEGRGKNERAALQLWVIVLWLVPWLTQSWAEYLRLQAFTIALAGFGYWALTLAPAGGAKIQFGDEGENCVAIDQPAGFNPSQA